MSQPTAPIPADARTITGRFSASVDSAREGPEMQFWPPRRRFRDLLPGGRPGPVFPFDYADLELRVLAHLLAPGGKP